MALTFNRNTGKWEIRVRRKMPDGTVISKRMVVGKDKQKAHQVHNKLKEQIADEKRFRRKLPGSEVFKKEEKPRTFAEEAEDFMESRANSKTSTVKSYRYILAGNLLPAFGNFFLEDLDTACLSKYQTSLGKVNPATGRKLTGTRVNNIMQLLRSILKRAEVEGRIKKDPSKAVKRATEDGTIIDPLSEDELELAFAHLSPHFQPFFIVQAYTGARPNELQALRWSDIGWNAKQIKISKGRVRGSEGEPKTKSGRRLIPMLGRVEEVLTKLNNERPDKVIVLESKTKGKKNSTEADDSHVFTTKAGNPIDKHLDRVWARALEKAGIRHRPSYQLRHTFITRCINENMPLTYIAKLVGHSTIDTIVRHYAGVIENNTTQYEQKLRAAFDGPKIAQPPLQEIAN